MLASLTSREPIQDSTQRVGVEELNLGSENGLRHLIVQVLRSLQHQVKAREGAAAHAL